MTRGFWSAVLSTMACDTTFENLGRISDRVYGLLTHPTAPALPWGPGSLRRSPHGSFHSNSVGTEAHGATPIAQCDEVVVSEMPHAFAIAY